MVGLNGAATVRQAAPDSNRAQAERRYYLAGIKVQSAGWKPRPWAIFLRKNGAENGVFRASPGPVLLWKFRVGFFPNLYGLFEINRLFQLNRLSRFSALTTGFLSKQ
jgi:hypothetical protein